MTRPVGERRVLALDEDDLLAPVLDDVLEGLGLRLVTERTPDRLLAALEGASPELVLLELPIDERPGLALLAEVVRRAPGARVVVIASRGSLEQERACLEAGAATYLRHGVDPSSTLRERVRLAAGATS